MDLDSAINNRQKLLAQVRQQQALEGYNNQKAQIDNKYNGGLGGFLGGLIGGIGKGIGDVAKGTFGVIGGGAAGIKDLLEGKAGTQENQNAFKRWLYDAEDDQDAAAKAAGTALNAATTLGTAVVPGVAGAGSAAGKALGGVAANTIGGAIGGAADELQQQGKDANLESAINRAISGGVAGLATGGVNRKIGNATSGIGSKLLNNKIATSTLGRGAISGAVGGATGGGTSAALGGGDIGQAAIQGGITGGLTGAAQAGLISGANALKQGISNRINNKTNTQPTNVLNDGTPDYTKPKDWNGAELTLEKKGVIGGLGDRLKNVSKGIKDQDVYNSLYSKTAEKVNQNNSIERLRNLGFGPKDYGNAAKISTATNKFFDDIVANSNASITDPELATRLYNPQDVTFQTNKLQQAYTDNVNNLMSRLEKGATPGNYSVKDLLDESRAFSKKAATEYRKGIDVNGNDVGNGRSDLGDAYMKISRDLRGLADAGMDGLGDNYTKSQLTAMLKNMGANDKVIDYMTDYGNLSDAIRKTSLFEDARQMNNEISKTKIRRNANAGSSKNVLTRVADKTGVTQLLDTVAEPVGRIAGSAAEKLGTGLQKLDTAIQNTTPISESTNLALGNFIGRTAGQQAAANNVQNARKAQDYQNLENMFSGLQSGSNGLSTAQSGDIMGTYPAQAQANPLEEQLNNIANGMNLAMAAGDFNAYNQLASLYKNAYSIYQLQAKSTGAGTSEMSTAEKNQIAKLQSAGTALDQLEELYNKAGGGQGVIGGNIANFLGGLGLNSDVNTYNQLAQGLINQIGAAIGKTDSLNTEGEVQRALSLVPKITDDNQTAMNKLATLRSLLQTNTGTYNQLYGA
jgi:hypothetical protein